MRPKGESIQIVIFSKNRACQLDSLLRSIRDHWRERESSIHVLYTADSEDFQNGYNLLKDRSCLDIVRWYRQTDFRENLVAIMEQIPDVGLLMFLVDDDIVYRPVELGPTLSTLKRRHLFVSLRASMQHSDAYPAPSFRNPTRTEVLEWKWNFCKKRMIPWNYPFSLDGNIFRAGVIKRITRSIRFAAPNSYEGAMHRYRHRWWVKRIPYALAPAEPVVFNNPLNKVQTEGETWHRNIEPMDLNRLFLDGMRIDNRKIYECSPDNVHFAVTPTFVKQDR